MKVSIGEKVGILVGEGRELENGNKFQDLTIFKMDTISTEELDQKKEEADALKETHMQNVSATDEMAPSDEALV